MMAKSKTYRPGDVILRCKTPFAYVVNQSVADFTCDECLKTTSDENQNEKFLRFNENRNSVQGNNYRDSYILIGQSEKTMKHG